MRHCRSFPVRGFRLGQSSAPWWRTFFDDAYVDAWAADGAFESTDEVAAQLIDFLDLPSRARVLDIPCGFGRFSQPLHDAGYDVVGVDGSDDQIRLAQQRHPGPTYLVGDMREPPSGPFDAVLNLYSSFGYFDDPADDIRCLSAWYEVLRPGGMLVLETMHRDRLAWLWGQDHDAGTAARLTPPTGPPGCAPPASRSTDRPARSPFGCTPPPT